MVIVRKSEFGELYEFAKMNGQSHVANRLNIKSLEAHQKEYRNGNVIFLSLLNFNQLAGYIILVRENNTKNVQFKRILVDERHLGVGQRAILAMENYCITELKVNRIWLDVFKSNNRAIHIYEKLGYKVFKVGEEDSRAVLFYEKSTLIFDNETE